MMTIAKRRFALYLSVIAVVVIQFTLGPSTHRRDITPAVSAPSGSVSSDPVRAVSVLSDSIPTATIARIQGNLQGLQPAAQLAWPNCSTEDRQRALDFVPGHLDYALPSYLKEYARFHREEMQKAMRNDAQSKQVKFLVYVCEKGHCGGLGDRFKGMIGALYLAVVTRRVLIIQHPGPPLSDFLVPHGIDWASWGACLGPYTAPGAKLLDAFLPPRWGHPKYTSGKMQEGMYDHLDGDLLVSDASNDTVPTYHLMINLPGWDSILDSLSAKSNMEQLGGTPWDPQSGPRFAWAWHLLFHPSQELQGHMSQMRSQLHIPSDGSPWVATHMRVGLSAEFKDSSRSPVFCTVDQGSKDYAACAANLAGIVSRPPFVRAGSELDPSSVPIFIASDNQEAVERMHAHLVGGGHQDAAVSYTGRKSVHVDRHAGRNATDEFMHTLAEMLLLSQATCLALGGFSGYSLVAMLLSQNLVTGARCYSANAGYADDLCTLAPLTDPRLLASQPSKGSPGSTMPGVVSANLGDLMRQKTQTIRQCSQVLLNNGKLCPKPLAVDIVFHAVVTGKHAIGVKFAILKLRGIQQMLAGLLMVREPCRIDLMFARRGLERETLETDIKVVDHYLTITVYVDDRHMQEAVGALATKSAGRLHGFVVMLVTQTLIVGYETSLSRGVNVTMIG